MLRLKALRTARGISQAELGEVLGCVGQTISKFERETRQLDPATIGAICDYFGCTADYLLGRSSSPLPVVTDADARVLAAYHSASLRDRALVDQILEPYTAGDQSKTGS